MAKVQRVKAKVLKSWIHKGKPTEVDSVVELDLSDYVFCLEKGCVEEAPNQPKAIGM